MIFQRHRFNPAEQAIAVLGQLAQVAIDLVIPVRKVPLQGEVFRLIDKPAANTAAIRLLQSDNIVVRQYAGNLVQGIYPPGMGQNVLPAASQVVAVVLGIDPYLNIEAEQVERVSTQPTVRLPPGAGLLHMPTVETTTLSVEASANGSGKRSDGHSIFAIGKKMCVTAETIET